MLENNPTPNKIRQAIVYLASNLSQEDYLDTPKRIAAVERGLEIVKSVPDVRIKIPQNSTLPFFSVTGPTEAIEKLRTLLHESGKILEYDESNQPFATGSNSSLETHSFQPSTIDARKIARETITPEARAEARLFFNLDD
jgi:hypothetical protein